MKFQNINRRTRDSIEWVYHLMNSPPNPDAEIQTTNRKRMKRNLIATIEDAGQMYIDVHQGEVSPATIHTYDNAIKHLVRFFGANMPIKELTYEHAERFRGNLFVYKRYAASKHSNYRYDGKNLSPATIRQILKCCRAIFAFIVKIDRMDFNPFDRVKLPKQDKKAIKYIPMEDIEKLLKQAERPVKYRKHDSLHVLRDVALVSALISTGCRVGGVASMTLSNLKFDGDKGTATVREKGSGAGRYRDVFLSESASLAMMYWLEARPKTFGHDFIFVGLNKGIKDPPPLGESGIYLVLKRLKKRWNEWCKKAPCEPIESAVNPHVFRHTFIKNMIRDGVPEGAIADMAGHTVKVMREEYGHLFIEDLRDMHSSASWLK